MKAAKRIVVWGALLTAEALFWACPPNSLLSDLQQKVNETQVGVPVTGVSLSPMTLNLLVGGTQATLTATIAPANATNQNVTWSSTATGVATVSAGVVSPVSVGTSTIKVTTADGGKTATCAVTVSSSSKAITSFSFVAPAVTGAITGTSITVTVPSGTGVTALVANFTTTGVSVKVGSTLQISGTTANDFTNPVTYIATAADGSTQSYTVTVIVALSSSKAITAFGMVSPAATGSISGTSIAVTVPFGTSVTALVASFTMTGVSVKVGSIVQVSGYTTNNFAAPVVYTVTAADSSTQNYTATVTVAPPSFTSYTTINGLGNDTVYGVAVSGSNIYAATMGGLSISTNGGNSWTNYTKANGLGVGDSSNIIQGVALYTGGGWTILAATYGGGVSISNAQAAVWTDYTTTTGLGNNVVWGVAIDFYYMCAATQGGLSVWALGQSNSWTNYTAANGLGSNVVNAVALSGSTIYAATDGGLSVSTNGGASWTNYTTANGLGNNTVRDVAVSGSTICVATYGGGVSISSSGGTSWSTYTTANGLGSNTVFGVAISGSMICAATYGGGVSISTNGGANWRSYTTANGLGNNIVEKVAISGSTIYAATYLGGLSVSH
jgi:hypothetical protein